MSNAWMVRAGSGSDIIEHFEKGSVTIGWSALGDISLLSSREEIAEAYRKAYPDAKPARCSLATGMVENFAKNPQISGQVHTEYAVQIWWKVTLRTHLNAVDCGAQMERSVLDDCARLFHTKPRSHEEFMARCAFEIANVWLHLKAAMKSRLRRKTLHCAFVASCETKYPDRAATHTGWDGIASFAS